jgi:predicted permease
MKLLSIILPVFALVLIGWGARRREILAPAAFHGLRDVVFFLAMPALLFSALVETPPIDLLDITSVYFAATLTIFACGFVAARLLRRRLAMAAMLGLNCSYGNTVLIGIPIVVAALGAEALPSQLAIIALHSAILLPLASVLVEMDGVDPTKRRPLAILVSALVAALRNPIIASILVAFLWRATGLPLPAPATGLLHMLGASATPLALICLGGSLPPITRRALDAETFIATGLKLVALPALVWALGRLAHLPNLPLTVAVLVGAMPTGANAFLLARRDERLAEVSAATVVATTVLSPLTLSALLQVLM